MTLSRKIATLLGENALSAALDEAREHVKGDPTDKEARHLYIDLLILSGQLEKADAQCSLAATFSPQDTMGFALLRNQLRAMVARQAWFESGAVPSFPGGPTPLDRAALDMALTVREGAGDAQSALSGFDDQRGERPIYWNGKKVADFRDLDDRLPHALEVLMTGGAYLWVDFSQVASVTVEPIARPRDLAYRRAELTLKDGAIAPVLLPAIYHGTRDDPTLLLGRETQWIEENGITTGRGQRCFLAGDELVSFHDARSFGVEAEGERERMLDA
ncbi:type VI secretion system accessory protein TagJ [Nitratireductor sp. ZSWI3]|uniref:type VI secretion system accessory protein TagJ n=1 Tax=Nitratireductor sp. ZSWI3 TaxID=2966359 RepID=UPI00214F7B52|nr:type VI secretion system accessory protein TagJ [Nitratireductor sp. ZSWI3]MCR4266314.1 nitrogen fixation protein [Nitratireductor sp. ZSWI3]